MDTLLLPSQNPRAWAETMINLEARKLVNTANTVAAKHLQDGLTRIQFVDEIRAFIMAQFEAARRAKTDDDCMAACRHYAQSAPVCSNSPVRSKPAMLNSMPR